MSHEPHQRYAYTDRDALAYGVWLLAVIGAFIVWYVADYTLP